MKKTFSATVVGIAQTDTSGFAAGAHSVSFDILAQSPLGQSPRCVELPLFSVDDARELGALYRNNGAVKITIQAGEPREEAAPAADDSNKAHDALRMQIARAVELLQSAVSGRMPSVGACRCVCADLVSAADAVFDGFGVPTPIVNGKPSCCEAGTPS